MGMESNREDEEIELPPGFRFHPTDEELITHYLKAKVMDNTFSTIAIGEVDLNKIEPWDLPRRQKMGDKEGYFFVVRDRKYPTGLRTNRATEAGYWKATGKDKEIHRAKVLVGMKKTLVFYTGRAPKGEKTNWIMHEFRLEGKYSNYNLPKNTKNDWVISRVFKKSSSSKKSYIGGAVKLHELHPSFLPPLIINDCFSNESMLEDESPQTKQQEMTMFGTSSSINFTTPPSISSMLLEQDIPDLFFMQDQFLL